MANKSCCAPILLAFTRDKQVPADADAMALVKRYPRETAEVLGLHAQGFIDTAALNRGIVEAVVRALG